MKTRLRGEGLTLLILCFAAFTLYGMYYNGFGTNAEATMAYFGIDEVKNGAIMTVQAVGCMAITILLGLYGERLNKIYALGAGLLLLGAAGVLIGLMPQFMAVGSYALMLGFSLIAGVGYISIDLLMNSVIADVYKERKNGVLPYVHAFYGAGAMIAPVFVTALVSLERPESFARPYLILGLLSLTCAALMLLTGKRMKPQTPYADMEEIRGRARQNPAEIFKESRAWLFCSQAS